MPCYACLLHSTSTHVVHYNYVVMTFSIKMHDELLEIHPLNGSLEICDDQILERASEMYIHSISSSTVNCASNMAPFRDVIGISRISVFTRAQAHHHIPPLPNLE